MLAALNSDIAGRSNLWSSANASATGINNPLPFACAPVADFSVTPYMSCAEQGIQYNDLSWNGRPSRWNWSFPGGSPSTSTDSMPVVYYSSPGSYNATLTVSNAEGSDSVTKGSAVHVVSTSVASLPYYQDFESASSFPGTDGFVINPDNGYTWVRTANVSYSGNSSIMMQNYNGSPTGEIDLYIAPAVDLTGINQPMMTFKLAYAQRYVSSSDMLKIFVSFDCGNSWFQRYNKSGATLSTAGVVYISFVPGADQWRTETVSLSIFAGKPNVRFKFENTSDNGNNVYIDDIRISGPVGIDEPGSVALNFEIYPNPSHGESVIHFDLQKESDTMLRLLDMTGRDVNTVINARMSAGMHSFNPGSGLAKGVYLVELTVDGTRTVKKLILE